MDKEYVFTSVDVSKTMLLGATLASVCMKGCVIYLYGCIGVGKSMFFKGFLRKLGYVGHVNSPTYTLVESYFVNSWYVHHFDFYRLNSSEELEDMGFRDYFDKNSLCLIEWPKKFMKIFLKEDIVVIINYDSVDLNVRKIVIKFISNLSKKMLSAALPYWNLFK